MKIVALITHLLLLSLYGYGNRVEGNIISKGVSRAVSFDIKLPITKYGPDLEPLQYRVKYYDQAGKKHILLPDDADEIRFNFEGTEFRMISCETRKYQDLFSPVSKIFLKLEIDGALRLYRFYYTGTDVGKNGLQVRFASDKLMLKKKNSGLNEVVLFGWKGVLAEYLNECPAVKERIFKTEKDLTEKDVEEIVIFYNQNCGDS